MNKFRIYINKDTWKDMECDSFDTDDQNNLLMLITVDNCYSAIACFKEWLYILYLEE